MIEVLSAVLLASLPMLNPEELPAYPGVALTRIGEQLVVDGMAQRLAYFVARDSLEAVALYFLREWSGKGYLTTADGDSRQGMVVSAFSTRESIQRTVVLHPQGGTTIGFSVLRSLRFSTAPLSVQPSVEGQLFVHDSRSPEEPRKHSHRTLLLNAGLTPARHSVIERLTATGCRVVEEGTASIDFRCPVGQVRILLIAQSPELTAVLETKLATGNARHREQEW
jgi:hypothetical protein